MHPPIKQNFHEITFEKVLCATQNDREEVWRGDFLRALEPEENYPVLTSVYTTIIRSSLARSV